MKGHSGTGFHKKNCCGLQQFATICSRDKRALHNIGCSAGPRVAGHEENVLNVKCPIPKISTFVDTCISGCFCSWQDSPCGHGMHHQLRDGRSSFVDLLQDHLTNSPLVKEICQKNSSVRVYKGVLLGDAMLEQRFEDKRSSTTWALSRSVFFLLQT